MGKYLDLVRKPKASTTNTTETTEVSCGRTFGRFGRFGRTYTALEERCPDDVDVARWQQCVADGRAFLATWSEQAQALGWTSADLFGLHPVPEKPHPSYNRLSRYDWNGLCWLLEGRRVTVLTEATALIENPDTGSTTLFRKNHRPALGPLGDSLDDFQ